MALSRDRSHNLAWVSGSLLVAVAALSAVASGSFREPPRFDGAGYAVLARALATGQGYREIDRPDAPAHAHFPPGYPIALATLWRFTGWSIPAAHGLSLAATVAAVVVAWRWFGTAERRDVAMLLGLTVAVNWTWARTAASIQSEPLYLLLSQLAVLAAVRAVRARGGVPAGTGVGVLLGACVVTRHVGVAIAVAIVLEFLLCRRFALAVAAGLTAVVVVAPWAAWVASVRDHTQVELLAQGSPAERVASPQAWFYLERIPDQIAGPVVEVGTRFGHGRSLAIAVDLGAALATAIVLLGFARCLRSPRRRLGGLVAVLTLALLLVWPFEEAGRFLIPLVPFLLLGAVEGLAAVLFKVRRMKHARRTAAWLVLAASLPYSAYALVSGRAVAQRRTHHDFDAACAWLADVPGHHSPVLSRYPGEVYWQTGLLGVTPPSDLTPTALDRLIEEHHVAYVLIDGGRFANAPADPLADLVARDSARFRETSRHGSARVYEVIVRAPQK